MTMTVNMSSFPIVWLYSFVVGYVSICQPASCMHVCMKGCMKGCMYVCMSMKSIRKGIG